jgi:dCTP diphosphatase
MSERIDQLLDEILKFRSDRDWEKFHTPRNLAISISLEAAELPIKNNISEASNSRFDTS